MDFGRLARFVAEVEKNLPPEVRNMIVEKIDEATETLYKMAEEFDKVADEQTADVWATYADNIQGDEDRVFDDLVKNFAEPDISGYEPPAAESGGSETSLSNLVGTIYKYLTENHVDYGPWNAENDAWNKEHPMFVIVDLLSLVADGDVRRTP